MVFEGAAHKRKWMGKRCRLLQVSEFELHEFRVHPERLVSKFGEPDRSRASICQEQRWLFEIHSPPNPRRANAAIVDLGDWWVELRHFLGNTYREDEASPLSFVLYGKEFFGEYSIGTTYCLNPTETSEASEALSLVNVDDIRSEFVARFPPLEGVFSTLNAPGQNVLIFELLSRMFEELKSCYAEAENNNDAMLVVFS